MMSWRPCLEDGRVAPPNRKYHENIAQLARTLLELPARKNNDSVHQDPSHGLAD